MAIIITEDEHERAVFRSRKMYQMDWDSDVKTARENGIKIGEKRIVQKMLSAGVPISQIALYTELTENEIKSLLPE